MNRRELLAGAAAVVASAAIPVAPEPFTEVFVGMDFANGMSVSIIQLIEYCNNEIIRITAISEEMLYERPRQR